MIYKSNNFFSSLLLALLLIQGYPLGTLVWGRYSKTVWWPGVVIRGALAGVKEARDGHVWIMWFGDYKISEVGTDVGVKGIFVFITIFKKSLKLFICK